MKYIKNELRNRMGDRWMNDYLIVYIEKYVICSIDNETIMQRFQNKKIQKINCKTYVFVCIFFFFYG